MTLRKRFSTRPSRRICATASFSLAPLGNSRELLIPQKGHFDFVLSLPGMELTPPDIGTLAKLIRQEVGASRRLEELV